MQEMKKEETVLHKAEECSGDNRAKIIQLLLDAGIRK